MKNQGRNEKCSCGSGKKYKDCCLLKNNSALLSSEQKMSSAANILPFKLQAAIDQYQAGRLSDAEISCLDILKSSPRHPEVLYLLGLIAYSSKSYDVAFDYLSRAKSIHPSNPFYLNLLGSIFCEQGKFDDAVICHRKAITLKDDFAEAYNNLGTDYKKLNNFQKSSECYQKAITLKPNYTKAYYQLGLVLHLQADYKNAVNTFQKALSLQNDFAEVYNSLGVSLHKLEQLNESESCCRKAISLKPDFSEAYNNLGFILQEQYKFNEAESCYRTALHLNPDYAEALRNLGVRLNGLGNIEEAETCYRKALSLKPDYVEAYDNLLFLVNYDFNGFSPTSLSEAKLYGSLVSRQRTKLFKKWPCAKSPIKIRIGFVSGDFINHPVGFFLEGLLVNIDQSKFELFAYTNREKEDELTGRIKPFFVEWRRIFNMSDEATAQLIHEDALHLLIDLSGHTDKNRLPVFAYKPAPVQVSWLGYVATTGVAEIDYVLGDPYVLPPQDEDHFTERVWRLPETYLCFTPNKQEFEVTDLPALTNGYITYGCFNNIRKINDEVVALWAKIMNVVPHSKLFFNFRGEQLRDKQVVENIFTRFASYGISKDRLIVEGTTTRKDYFNAYNRVDIALDPYPYPGVTISAEGLWMGVPVLTKRGDYFLPHNGETIAHNTGQSVWIADDDDDYVKKAVSFSSDLEALAKLRRGLREQVLASPLFNASRFARNFEEAMWGMWNAWVKKS